MSHVTYIDCACSSYLLLLGRGRWHVAFFTGCRGWWNRISVTCRRRVQYRWHICNILCPFSLAICRSRCRYERRHICNIGLGLLLFRFLLPAATVICHHLFGSKDQRGCLAHIIHCLPLCMIISGCLS